MKKIYVIMAELPTFTSKFVTMVSRIPYSHFSISLDDKFDKLYSFQVQNYSIPYVGGFSIEDESSFFHGKRNISLKELIVEIPVSNKVYKKINDFINEIKNDKEYIFNYVSILFMFYIGGVKAYKAYHCCEFVSKVLDLIDDIKLPKNINRMHPKDLYKLLIKYPHQERVLNANDYVFNSRFYNKVKLSSKIKKSWYSTTESIYRVIFKRTRKNYNYNKQFFNLNDYCN